MHSQIQSIWSIQTGKFSLTETVATMGDDQVLEGMDKARIERMFREFKTDEESFLKPAIAMGIITYGLLWGPTTYNGGISYNFSLKAATGGEYPDIKIGIEGRKNGNGTNAFVIRGSFNDYKAQINVGSQGVTFSGGMNIPVFDKNPVALGIGDLKIEWALRANLPIDGRSLSAGSLSTFLEFVLTPGVGEDLWSPLTGGDPIFGDKPSTSPSNSISITLRSPQIVIPFSAFNHGINGVLNSMMIEQ